MQNALKQVYNKVVVGKQKAVAAAVVAFVVSFVGQHFGKHAADALQQVVSSGVLAVLAHVSVYFTGNK